MLNELMLQVECLMLNECVAHFDSFSSEEKQ